MTHHSSFRTHHSKRAAYPAYKPSGVEWVGDVPEHWEVRRLKYTAGLINVKVDGADTDLPYTGLEHIESWTGKRLVLNGDATNEGQANLYQRGDVLFGKLRPYLAKAHAADSEGICTGELLVLRPKEVDQKFLLDYVLNPDFVAMVDSSTYGAKMPRANWDFIGNLPALIPPQDDQRAIAAFLDRETARIDTLIEKKRRQIELLQEKRSALIHQAIHHPRTKDLRLKHVADHVARPIDRKDEEVYTAVGLYNWARGIFHKEPRAGRDLGDSDFFWLKSDDLILSGQFAWEGAVALASEEEEGCVVSHRYPVLRGKPDLMDTAYLWAFFTTKRGHFFLDDHSRGAAGRNRPLNINTLSKEVIPVPPLIEQKKVAEHVYFERRFKKIIARSIDLLQEYRAALISAVVTGKIDVREDNQNE